MKKVLFLQNKGKTYGGVWQVNKLVGEELIKYNYQVSIVSIRNNQNNLTIEHNSKLNVFTINEKDLWETYAGSDILKELKDGHIIRSFKMIINRLIYQFTIKNDIIKLHKYIDEYKPDYIITSHYQLIDMIPNSYLSRTIHEQHTSFKSSIEHLGTKRVFDKYKDKIKFLWLSKKTMEDAKEYGIKDNCYIYNAVRFETNKRADVIKNKKLVTIARFCIQKRIDIMINVVNKIFNDPKYDDWVFEIYGSGEEEEYLKSLIKNERIKIMGKTNNPIEVLLTSSINLNTSSTEGFCLSILEANECGIPTVSLDFGESVKEEIIDNETGLIIYNDDILEYEKRLRELMLNNDKLELLSKNCKEFNKKFHIDSIIKEWEKLLKK